MTPRHARLLVLLPDELLSEIDLARRTAPDLPPRAEMIRRLIRRGLATHTTATMLYQDRMKALSDQGLSQERLAVAVADEVAAYQRRMMEPSRLVPCGEKLGGQRDGAELAEEQDANLGDVVVG